MFTVIICDEKIKKDCEERYSLFLSPLAKGNFAFCTWNPFGVTPDEMFIGLPELVRNVPEWRAVIVLNAESYGYGNISKRNPFDYTGFHNLRALPENAAELEEYRNKRLESYSSAVYNPLLKSACWLCEPPIKEDTVEIDPELIELAREMPEDYFDILKMKNIDPYNVESDICEKTKYQVLSTLWKADSVLFNLPKQVVCISERHYDSRREEAADAWKHHDEFEYTEFVEPNMYPAKLRYLLFDINYCNGERKIDEYINFLSFLLVFASNEYPVDAIKAYRIYKVNCVTDRSALSRALSIYDSKLSATQVYIRQQIRELGNNVHNPATDAEMDNYYLGEFPVNVTQFEEVDTKPIYTDSEFAQLATDKPGIEAVAWAERFKTSKKSFVKFLKEPRRSVKRAVDATRSQLTIDSEDVFYMTDFQLEDIAEKINNDEQDMVSIVTEDIYNTERYKKRIDDEGDRVAKHISLRMRAKTIAIIMGIAVGTYFIGFLPMFFSNLNTAKSMLFSLIVTAVSVGLVAAAGFVALLVFRYLLKKSVKNYNIAMSHMIGELRNAMDTFGQYLTHFKGYMKRTSIFKRLHENEKAETIEERILHKHLMDIDEVRNHNRLIFREYEFVDMGNSYNPYVFDFTKPESYNYDFPYSEIADRRIVFIQNGNKIVVPIDFIKEITITREELYD
ncbi:MAG: hypothetical protein J6Q94_03875 [Clostridia bacterium]|nr:hypothetical protein [Clostridia bacterium]